MKSPTSEHQAIPFWRDERVLRVLGQILFLVLVVAAGSYIFSNMWTALEDQGMTPDFSYLGRTSGFDIGFRVMDYSRESTNARAILIGVLNTLAVSAVGIVLATILGVIIGVARLSDNVVIAGLSRIYLEILRNVPLLVLIIFWYSGAFIAMPRIKEAIEIGPAFLSNRGAAVPWGIPGDTFQTYLMILAGGLVAAIIVGWRLHLVGQRTGRPPMVTFWSLVTLLVVGIVGWLVLPQAPLTADYPELQGLNFVGGQTLTPEFMALLSALVIYTSAFIGEVVRAGIMSVSKGQVEAARALGLSGLKTLRLVVFPQAMRVIVPPLTSNYLNLTKNSSLAIAIGYPDLFSVSGTMHNQTGRSVEAIALMMAIYLSLSLLTSLFMNWYNKRIRLVER